MTSTTWPMDITVEEEIDIPSIQAEKFQKFGPTGVCPTGSLIRSDVLMAAPDLRDKDPDSGAHGRNRNQQQAAAKQQAGQISRNTESKEAPVYRIAIKSCS